MVYRDRCPWCSACPSHPLPAGNWKVTAPHEASGGLGSCAQAASSPSKNIYIGGARPDLGEAPAPNEALQVVLHGAKTVSWCYCEPPPLHHSPPSLCGRRYGACHRRHSVRPDCCPQPWLGWLPQSGWVPAPHPGWCCSCHAGKGCSGRGLRITPATTPCFVVGSVEGEGRYGEKRMSVEGGVRDEGGGW